MFKLKITDYPEFPHIEEVQRWNVPPKTCGEQYCENRAEYFAAIPYYGLTIYSLLCEEHYDQVMKYWIDKNEESKNGKTKK
jgi:hypothetical protein